MYLWSDSFLEVYHDQSGVDCHLGHQICAVRQPLSNFSPTFLFRHLSSFYFSPFFFFAVGILLSISCSFSPELFLKSFSYGGDGTLLQKSEPSAVFVQFSFNTISPKTHLPLYILFSVLLAMLRYELTPQKQSDNARSTWFILFLLSPFMDPLSPPTIISPFLSLPSISFIAMFFR